ncbi:MAG: PilZ domain-containing protein [Nitrospirae bacterium]|nr:PilZ domain-containing protein [Nitrospirota bacterium]
MENRRSKRIAVGYKAEIIYGGKSFECVIENLSNVGAYIVTASTNTEINFKPQEMLELRFEPNSGEIVNLQCRIMWSKQTLPHRLTNRIGLEILNPSWDQSTSFV